MLAWEAEHSAGKSGSHSSSPERYGLTAADVVDRLKPYTASFLCLSGPSFEGRVRR